ncbi:MAG: 6-phosphofructokinase [Clostridiales bacterium]|jgi:6-phosphofructokinase 1|nr:6-phosphofructokinase [Clostridiales bacterium]
MKRIGVLTSGGDAPGMNAAIRAVVRYGIYHDMEVYGIRRGYEGLIDGDIERLYRRSVGDIMQRGGTILKTARSAHFQTPEGMEKGFATIKDLKIEDLVVIGGNGSLTGAKILAERHGVNVIGIPGTIDNDLGYTDYTIGYDTALNTVLDAITRIRDTSSAHERTTVIEVMGRECGDIALYAGVAGGAECVLLPEFDTDLEAVCKKVTEGVTSGKLHNIIIKAEGVPVDSHELVHTLADRTGRDVKLVVLSYLQRGGSPTYRDRILATECGMKAIDLIRHGETGKAIGEVDGRIIAVDLDDALKAERGFDLDMYKAVDILSM